MEFDVVVVGAGLAGLFAGGVLGRRGLRVCVIDDRPAFHHQIGEHVQEATLEVLARLAPDLLEWPVMYRWKEARVENLASEFRLNSKFGLVTWEHNYFLNRQGFDSRYASVVRGLCDLRMGTKAVEILSANGAVQGVRVKRNDGTEAELRAKTVIVAGGLRSRPLTRGIFKYAALDAERTRPRQVRRAIYSTTPGQVGELEPAVLYMVTARDRGNDLILVAARQDPQTSLFYIFARADSHDVKALPLGGDLAAKARSLFPGLFAERMIADLERGKIEDDELASKFSMVMEGTLLDGLIPIGTAAGYSEPLAGHGITLAVADAVHVCQMILDSDGFRPSKERVTRHIEKKKKMIAEDFRANDLQWNGLVRASERWAKLADRFIPPLLGWLPPLAQPAIGPFTKLRAARLTR